MVSSINMDPFLIPDESQKNIKDDVGRIFSYSSDNIDVLNAHTSKKKGFHAHAPVASDRARLKLLV